MNQHKTRYQKIIKTLSNSIIINTVGPWKTRSIGLISILLGYYLASNVASYLINNQVQKTFIIIFLLTLVETFIRLRLYLIKVSKFSLILNSFDNIRIGITYAIVLEAFKLGS